MGTYYRIVCEEHNEVLDLNKAYELKDEIRDFVLEHHLTGLIFDEENSFGDRVTHLNENLKLICREHYSIPLLNKNINTFLRKHSNCDLTFQPDEPYDEEIRKEEGWKWYNVFGSV